MVNALLGKLPADTHLDIVTTVPNRYVSYSEAILEGVNYLEEHDQYTIHRVALPPHESGMLDQSKSFIVFAREALRLTKQKRYQLIIATSSRLMTASLAAYIAAKKCSLLYLDIRDIFVDTIKDLLPSRGSIWLTSLLALLERKTILRAEKVNLVSAGFLPYFRERYPTQNFTCYTNGIDQEFITADCLGTQLDSHDDKFPIKVLYAGNIGEGQGLHHILPGLAKALNEKAHFIVIGDGGRLDALRTAIKESGCTNIELRPPMSRPSLFKAYLEADVLFLHMNNFPAFEKALPSKIFEYAALGKPVLAGVAGYSAEFISKEISNAQIFRPCDVSSAVNALGLLELKMVSRSEFVEKYSRSHIMREMAADILSLLPANK